MKKLLHIIESLGLGGAEQLVVGIINGLDGYEHHLIILNEPDHLRAQIRKDYFFLNLKIQTKLDLLLSARKIKRYIRDHHIDIVHSHLYWANILSRIAVPKNIPVFNSIHAISSQAAYNGNKMTLHLEKLTYRKRHHIVSVSKEVLKDFAQYIKLKGEATVLYNFVDENFFAGGPKKDFSREGLKLVAVGNLRHQKNYPYLLESFKKIPASVSLDIYGEGSMRKELQQYIDEHGLQVRLCGLSRDLGTVLPKYDAFVMSSFFEGQPLSLLEALAAGLPAILADIPVLREITGNDSLYFDIRDKNSFCRVIESVLNGDADLRAMSEASHRKVNSFAHRQQYFERLKELYNKTVQPVKKATPGNDLVKKTPVEKPTIVQVINDLGRGGAETLLVGLLKDLSHHYNIVLVTLNELTEFDEEDIVCSSRYNLRFKKLYSLPQAVVRLRKIIKKHNPVLVVSHLYWSTVISRLSTPKHVPFISNLHLPFSQGAFTPDLTGRGLKILEKLTYSKREILVGVSKDAIDDYDSEIGIKGRNYVLHNYVNEQFFERGDDYRFQPGQPVRIVAVGNPRPQKNYELLVRAFQKLDPEIASCDIYGISQHNAALQKLIDKTGVPVNLKGKADKVHEILNGYSAFIMCSKYEGFGIAAAEAMALGLPLFLSDLKVLREISRDNAIFFNPDDGDELAEKIREFHSGKYDAKQMSELGKKICCQHYSKEVYLKRLLDIYEESIKGIVPGKMSKNTR